MTGTLVQRGVCHFDGCGRPVLSRGLCGGHYKQLNSGRDLAPLKHQVSGRTKTVEQRLIMRRKVDEVSGCWLWTGSRTSSGYGQMQVRGVIWIVHRLSYAIHVGPIGEETVHHICAVRLCFNPEHLQLVSMRENIAEMRERQAYRRQIARLRGQVAVLESEVKALRERAGDGPGRGYID